MAYKVVGGVHRNTKFDELVGEREEYGPFPTYAEAETAWRANMWLNVDNALHRLRILRVETN